MLANAMPISLWPRPPDVVVPQNKREGYKRNCTAIEMYVNGVPVEEIQQVTGIPHNCFAKMLRRCLTVNEFGEIFGFNALIPDKRTKAYERTQERYVKFQEAQGGLSGVFNQTLKKYPSLEQYLIDLILKNVSIKNRVHEHRVMAIKIHKAFLDRLKQLGVSQDSWPFNTKYLGLSTITRYVRTILNQNFAKGVARREGKDAKAHLAVGTGKKSLIRFTEPYDGVELDAYHIDAFFTATFESPEGIQVDVQLDRLWWIAMVEVVSGAILAHTVVYRSEVNAGNVVDVIRNAVQIPDRIPLTIEGLAYPDQGGLPGEVIPQLKGALWSSMKLDNALVHLAKHIHNEVKGKLGFAINWGIPGHFERRPNIERLFGEISKSIFLRYPSTTGSGPKRGRADKAEEKAVKYKLRADEAEQLLAVRIAQYNAEPKEGAFYNSPLEVLKYFVEQDDNYEPRRLPADLIGAGYVLPMHKECTVRGCREEGRRPYIEFAKARYTNPTMANLGSLIGKKIKIEIDINNVQYVRAFLSDGSELGVLKAMGRWGHSRHGLKTRQVINRLVSKKILVCSEHTDVVRLYMNFVSQRLHETKRQNRQLTPRAATEAVRISKETGLPRKISDPTKPPGIPNSPPFGTHKRDRIMPGPAPDLKKILRKRK